MSNYQERRVTADDDETNLTEDNESVDQTTSTASASRRSGTANSRQSRPSTSRELVTWSSLQIQEESCNHQQADDRFAHLRDVILIDTGSTLKATFMNPDLVLTDIQVSENPVSMTTNAGNKTITLEATVPGNGPTLFDPNQIANIYGFSHMADDHRITYDSNVEDAFNLYLPDGMIKFERTDDGLYAYRPSDNYRNQVAESNSKTPLDVNNMVTTVKENKMGLETIRECEESQTIVPYRWLPYCREF
jgi:hypothetical protein